MALAKPRLTYFSSRGLTESIRVLLADIGVDYEDAGVGTFTPAGQPEGFKTLIASGKLPFDQLPIWEEPSGLLISQSQAIVRHIARTHGYAGDNATEAAFVDQAHEGVIDVQQRVSIQARAYRTATADAQKAEAKENAIKDINKALNKFENLLHKNHDGKGFIASNKISYADIALYYFLEAGGENGLVKLDAHPLLHAYKERIENRPHIAQYRKNPHRYPPQPVFA